MSNGLVQAQSMNEGGGGGGVDVNKQTDLFEPQTSNLSSPSSAPSTRTFAVVPGYTLREAATGTLGDVSL